MLGPKMSGRADSVTQAAAILRVNEAAKYAHEIREHMDRVRESPAFKGSQRSQEFLRYVVEKALRGEFEELRERSIGVALFDKPAAYDTAGDAIVRVTASDVRRRLLQYYGQSEADRTLRIDLPAGTYIPLFRGLEGRTSAPATEAQPENISSEAVHSAPAALTWFSWRTFALAALLAQALTVAWWWSSSRVPAPAPATRSFFSAAFGSRPGTLQVVVGDDGLLLIKVLAQRDFTLEEYEKLKYLTIPESVRQKGLQQFWESLATRQLANLGHLHNAARVADAMRAQKWTVNVRHARQVNPGDLRSGDFVILGSPHSNPWASLFQAHSAAFAFEPAPPGQWSVIRNRQPLAGEPSTYEVHTDPRTGKTLSHAVVSLVQNASRTGRVLLLAGQTTSATELAGEFLMRTDALDKVLRTIGHPTNGTVPDLEMILQITEVNEVGDGVALIGCRKLDSRPD